MRVALFSVKYSPNLGDGVIAECLEHELRSRGGWVVHPIDLAGRRDWRAGGGYLSRTVALKILQMLPQRLGEFAVGAVKGWAIERRLRPAWRHELADVDAAILGGGQLIQDQDLNFPLKVSAALEECDRRRIPVAVFGVGCSRSRSRAGREMFQRVLRGPGVVMRAARDTHSHAVLAELGGASELCGDPGLLAARVWPVTRQRERPRLLIGLGIVHPVVLAHHGYATACHSRSAAIALYMAMAEALARAGHDVLYFTNGAAEDERLLGEIARRISTIDRGSTHVSVAPRCGQPEELARMIAQCDVVVAHRLHALILAFAYRVPPVALQWDGKVDAFMQGVDLSGQVLPFDSASAENIAHFVMSAKTRGIDPANYRNVIKSTDAGVARLMARLEASAFRKQLAAGEASNSCAPMAGIVGQRAAALRQRSTVLQGGRS